MVVYVLQCSHFHCDAASQTTRRERAEKLQRQYDVGERYRCYYSDNHAHVALIDVVTVITISNCMVWSFGIVAVGIVVCTVTRFCNRQQVPGMIGVKPIEPLDRAPGTQITITDEQGLDLETFVADNSTGMKSKTPSTSVLTVSSPEKKAI